MTELPRDFGTKLWAVVNTHAHKERLALDNLARQDFETYCPRIHKRIRHARRVHHVQRPLFPGYVFISVDPGRRRWRPILSTIGVRSLVRFGDRLGMLDDQFIQCLKAREQDGVIVRSQAIERPVNPYKAGEQVKINGGPFDGRVATILSASDKDRLVVLMDLLQNSIRTRIAVEQVVRS